jgi:tetratricopeptide (TPR) repeat protein
VQPDRWTAYYNRALVSSQEKKWPAALQDLNTTIKLQPAFFEASWKRAGLYLDIGNYAAALKDLDILAKLTLQVQQSGQYALVLNQRAWLRATCPEASFRNGQLAIADSKRACQLSKWNRAGWVDTLAAAYAETGDFDAAVRYEQQAITMSKTEPEVRDRELRSTIGRPLREKERNDLATSATKSAQGFLKRLELYKQHSPFREPRE